MTPQALLDMVKSWLTVLSTDTVAEVVLADDNTLEAIMYMAGLFAQHFGARVRLNWCGFPVVHMSTLL
jgi:hypothetical protein